MVTLNGIRNIGAMRDSIEDILAELHAISKRIDAQSTDSVRDYLEERISYFGEELKNLSRTEALFLRKLDKIYKLKDIL